MEEGEREESGYRNLDDAMGKFFEKKKNPTSERAHIIQTICDSLFTQKEFPKLLGQTKLLTTNEIRDIFEEAKAWNVNPQALFWKLLKEKRLAIQQKMKEDGKKLQSENKI